MFKKVKKSIKVKVALLGVLGILTTTYGGYSVNADVEDSKQSTVTITLTEGNKGVSINNHKVEEVEDGATEGNSKEKVKSNTKLSDIDFLTNYKLNVRYVNPKVDLNPTEGVYNLLFKDLNSVEYITTKEEGKSKTVIRYNNAKDYLLGKEYIEVYDNKEGIGNINLRLEDLNKLSKESSDEGYVEYLFVDGVI